MSARGRTWVFGMSAGWKDPGRLARAGVELLTVPWEAVEQPSTRVLGPACLPVCLGLTSSCGDACRAHAQNMRPHNRPVLAFSRDLLRAKARAWA